MTDKLTERERDRHDTVAVLVQNTHKHTCTIPHSYGMNWFISCFWWKFVEIPHNEKSDAVAGA